MLAEKRQKQRMKSVPDRLSQFGPPDRSDTFVTGPSTSRKRADNSPHLKNTPKHLAVCVDNSIVDNSYSYYPERHTGRIILSTTISFLQYFPNYHPEILGKHAMRFETESGK